MRDLNIKLRMEYSLLGLRDKLGFPFKPEKELKKLNLEKGEKILDYGGGIGSYTFPAASLVGEEGKVYAVDKQSSAIKRVKEKARMEGINNIATILSDGDTGLPDKSVGVILLYGVLPEIKDRESLLKELYRVLKPNGYLSTRSCFRMKKDKVLEIMQATGLFSLREQKGHILNFEKSKIDAACITEGLLT
ncbi:MAG: methyltransferase domain-containing protein [Chloroflexota bacterium]|nr:methyltransferase domain-containing protein [Chloroflexota bacterium]